MSDLEREKIKWPINIDAMKILEQSSATFATIVLSLSILLIAIAALAIGWILVDLLSGDQKRAAEAARTAFPILAAAIGLPLLIWRLRILDRQTRISEEKTQIDRQTHYTSIFSRSVEQLGQTRESKSFRISDDKEEPITRTIPNIEVRLGGIHSLARLAEESTRDFEKIENTLLSYVRENSWADRNGITTAPLGHRSISAWDWQYPYWKGNFSTEASAALKTWDTAIAESTKQRLEWSSALKETRVDVSEAVDAISKLGITPRDDADVRFYECLFVGKQFKLTSLNSVTFERCFFVNCLFEVQTRHIFLNSQLFNCTIERLSGSKMRFSRCTIDKLSVNEAIRADFVMNSCDASHLTMYKVKECALDLAHSTIREFRLTASKLLKLNFRYTAIKRGRLSDMVISESSDFTNCALADVSFTGTDLSKVTKISSATLEATISDPAAKHPQILNRPNAWDAYDADYSEDEVPF